MLKEAIESLKIKQNGIYVDLTYGGGGHSKEILRSLGKNGKLFAFDQDSDASKNKIPVSYTHLTLPTKRIV